MDALACLDAAVDEAERVLGLDDLRDDRGELELVDENTGEVIDVVPAPIAVVSDNGSCCRGETYQSAFAGDEPLLRHVRTRVRSPQTKAWVAYCTPSVRWVGFWCSCWSVGGGWASSVRGLQVGSGSVVENLVLIVIALPTDNSRSVPLLYRDGGDLEEGGHLLEGEEALVA